MNDKRLHGPEIEHFLVTLSAGLRWKVACAFFGGEDAAKAIGYNSPTVTPWGGGLTVGEPQLGLNYIPSEPR